MVRATGRYRPDRGTIGASCARRPPRLPDVHTWRWAAVCWDMSDVRFAPGFRTAYWWPAEL